MLYNKNNVRKINDKKILHKVGKHWATISIAMLAMIGGGAAVSTGHVSMPSVGVVAHASNNISFTNSSNATMPENQTVNNNKVDTVDGGTASSSHIIPDNDVVVPGQGYTVGNATNDSTNYKDGAGTEANIITTDSNPGNNYNINLARKDTDTVKFNDDGNPVGNTSYLTGPDGYSYNLQNSDYNGAGLPTNLANSNHNFTFNGGTHNIDISNHKYAATVQFQNSNNSALNGKNLSLNYNGQGRPNLNTSALNDLSANNLSINPEFSDIKSASDLKNDLTGFRIVPQNIHFDDYTLGGPYNYYENGGSGTATENNVNLVQNYDANVKFYDQSGHQIGNQKVVDFGQSVPANYNNSQGVSLYDLQQEDHFALPSGYVLGNGQNCPSPALSANSPVYFNGGSGNNNQISNTSMNTMNISVTHNQNTPTTTWRAAIQFVDANGNPVGGVQDADTGNSDINALESGHALYQQEFGNRPGFTGANSNTFLTNNTSVNVPDGYSVKDGPADSNAGNAITDNNGYVNFEMYSNPAVTNVEVVPSQEARVTFKDAATGNVVGEPTNITLSNGQNPTVSAANNNQNGNGYALDVPAGYSLDEGYNGQVGNPMTGLYSGDTLNTTGADSVNSNDHDNNVPNSVVFVNRNNTNTAHVAIQFTSPSLYSLGNDGDIGDPVVVDTGTNYTNEPALGTVLSSHNIIPSGYQLESNDENNTPVHYGNDESPKLTHVSIVPKSSNTYHAAIQFTTGTNNVGAPVMIDTGSTSSYGLAKEYDATDNNGSFLHQYNLAKYVPKGYEIAPTGVNVNGSSSNANKANAQIHYDTSAGADAGNFMRVTVKPVNAPTTDANSNAQPTTQQVSDIINYMYNGNSEGTANVTGNQGDSAATAINSNVPNGYSLKNDGSQNVNFDGNNHNVNIVKNGSNNDQAASTSFLSLVNMLTKIGII